MKRPFDRAEEMLEGIKRAAWEQITQDQPKGLPRIFWVDNEERRHSKQEARFFLRKNEASDYARSNGNLPMWSIDKFNSATRDNAGAKYYAVASYDVFYDLYARCDRPHHGTVMYAVDRCWVRFEQLNEVAANRDSDTPREVIEREKADCLRLALRVYPFAYEVVMEGVPLHLYLDMEGSKTENPEMDFDARAVELINELVRFMFDMHVIPAIVERDEMEAVVLDSSTGTKFSKHVVIKIPECVFANNYVCGALLRNFHLHLMHRYGPPETNKFYIRPFEDAKSKLRVCMLDFAVYTKHRDFRIIGSCKRKGCNDPKTALRWMWKEPNGLGGLGTSTGKIGELTKELFLECLIQNTNELKTRYTIARIIDPASDDGIPFSSSLRTAISVNGHSSGGSAAGGGGGVASSRTTFMDDHHHHHLQLGAGVVAKLEQLGYQVARYVQDCPDYRIYFRYQNARIKDCKLSRLRDGNLAWFLTTQNCRYCSIRKEKTGSAEHKPGGRSVTFIVWATGLLNRLNTYDEKKVGTIKHTCIANSCTGGMGSSQTAWSGYVGDGLSQALRKQINDMIRPYIQAEIARLGLNTVQAENCLFPEGDDDDDE